MELLDRGQIPRYYSASIYLEGQRETRDHRIVGCLDFFATETFEILVRFF